MITASHNKSAQQTIEAECHQNAQEPGGPHPHRAPRGSSQVAEMQNFGETFTLLDHSSTDPSLWQRIDRAIVSVDAIKPLKQRRGWTPARVHQHNRDRFHAVTEAGWDLIIVDEAHKLAGTNRQVARHTLGRALARSARHLLLLSATPHQGKTDAFMRLMSLLDPATFREAARSPRRPPALHHQDRETERHRHRRRPPLQTPADPDRQGRMEQRAQPPGRPLRRRHRLRPDRLQPRPYREEKLHRLSHGPHAAPRLQQHPLHPHNSRKTPRRPRSVPVTDRPRRRLVGSRDQEQIDGRPCPTLSRQGETGQKPHRLLPVQAARPERPNASSTHLLHCGENNPNSSSSSSPSSSRPADALNTSPRGFSVVCLNGSMDMDERRRTQQAFATDARSQSPEAGGGASAPVLPHRHQLRPALNPCGSDVSAG